MNRIWCIAVATLGRRSYVDRQAAASSYEILRTAERLA
jgi:hypothetical protein